MRVGAATGTVGLVLLLFWGNVALLRRFHGAGGEVDSAAASELRLHGVQALVEQLQSEVFTMNTLLNRPNKGPSFALSEEVHAADRAARVQQLRRALVTLEDEIHAQGGLIVGRLAESGQSVDRLLQRADALSRQLEQAPPPASPPPAAAAGSTLGSWTERISHTVATATAVAAAPRPASATAPLPATVARQAPPVADGPIPMLGGETAVLMICYARDQDLERALSAVKAHFPAGGRLPVFISQDGDLQAVSRTIQKFDQSMRQDFPEAPVVHLRHRQDSNPGDTGYHRLAQHYGWALAQVFDDGVSNNDLRLRDAPRITRVIILEEDLEVAPDFFEYFAATAPLLDDPAENLLTVSAWNDNGQRSHVKDPRALYRSSFFPGLGWMMTRTLWEELSPKWPKAYWDDWLREPPQQRNRHVIRPEVCRTYHFATSGTSQNQYGNFLASIQLNRQFVPFRTLALEYLRREAYDRHLGHQLADAPLVSVHDARQERFPSGAAAVRVEYQGERGFESVARQLGIMDNIKAGVPRVAYHGVVTVRLGETKQLVHVSPPLQETGLV